MTDKPDFPGKIDEELIFNFSTAPDGDENAFNELVKRHYERLIKHANFEYLHNETEARDAVQETFKSIFRSAKTFNPARASFRTWIDTICKNECLKIIRNKPKTEEFPKDTEGENIEIEDGNATQDNKRKELREEYLGPAALDQKERKIIELHLLDDRMYVEIQAMNLPELKDETGQPLSIDAMEKIYNRALKKLQDYHRKKKEER